MVTVIDPKPHYSQTKQTHCKNCGATLEYTRNDTKNRQYSSMGETNTYFYIICPCCNKETDSGFRVRND